MIASSKPPKLSADAYFYLAMADGIQAGRSETVLTTERAMWTVFALPTLMIVSRNVAPERWPALLVALHVLCMSVASVLLIRLVCKDMLCRCLATTVVVTLIRGIGDNRSPARRRIVLALFLAASFVIRASGALFTPLAWLHAITALDFDWRCRLPTVPVLIFLAGCGVEPAGRWWFRAASASGVLDRSGEAGRAVRAGRTLA